MRSIIDDDDKANSDENTTTDLSENEEGELALVSNIGPHKTTNLETYFRNNYDFGKVENRLINDMVTICDNKCNGITFI